MPNFDQSIVNGAQKSWSDEDLFMPNPQFVPGYNPPANPPPPAFQPTDPPLAPDIMPPVDIFQPGRGVPPRMAPPMSHRYVQNRRLPSWQSGSLAGETAPIIGDAGPVSPLLAIAAAGAAGYMLAGWQGGLGLALMIVGANNLGLAASGQPALRLGAAAIGLGGGGYLIWRATHHGSTRPNAPKWLKRVKDADEDEEGEDD